MSEPVFGEDALKVSQSAEELATIIVGYLEGLTGKSIGFQLFLWPDKVCTYVGNVNRQMAGNEIKRIIASWEQGMPDIPAHEKH